MSGKTKVAGTLIATAVGLAAGVAAIKLSDEKNRKKLSKTVSDLAEKANRFSKEVDENSKPVLKSAKKISEDVKRDSKPAVKQIKKVAREKLN